MLKLFEKAIVLGGERLRRRRGGGTGMLLLCLLGEWRMDHRHGLRLRERRAHGESGNLLEESAPRVHVFVWDIGEAATVFQLFHSFVPIQALSPSRPPNLFANGRFCHFVSWMRKMHTAMTWIGQQSSCKSRQIICESKKASIESEETGHLDQRCDRGRDPCRIACYTAPSLETALAHHPGGGNQERR